MLYNMLMSGRQLYLFTHHKDSTKASGRPKVILPLDTIILLGVIIILLFTISFSMGVERGKNITDNIEKAGNKTIVPVQSQDNTATSRNTSINKDAGANQQSSEEAENERKRYHVQVASFKKENSARKEVERLEENGYPVRILKKGEYIVIYVGGFENEGEAKNNFKNLRKKYKDCIFKNSL